jgi:hypothetical protein
MRGMRHAAGGQVCAAPVVDEEMHISTSLAMRHLNLALASSVSPEQ